MNKNNLIYDILKEIFNISAGKAASMLSEITNKRILFNVPDIKILNLENKNIEISEYFTVIPEGALMVSSINFGNKVTGGANLIFPANKMRRFLNICMGEEIINMEEDMDFTDMDFDIIREVGNIILNSIIGEMGNLSNISLQCTLPKVEVFDRRKFTKDIKNKRNFYIFILYITFIISDTKIEGAVTIDFMLNSFNELMKLIKRAEDDLYE